MKSSGRQLVGILFLMVMATFMLGQPTLARDPSLGPDQAGLQALAEQLSDKWEAGRTARYYELAAERTGVMGSLNLNPDMQLMGLRANGSLRVYMIENLNAAVSVGVDHVWPGGATGLNLDGANGPGQLAVWDAGAVLLGHQEFGGRVVMGDAAALTHYHSTHVAGTMVAAGVDPAAKGMSPAALLTSYDWTDDEIEMAAAAAAGLRLSQHSYGYATGWSWISSGEYWIWYGWGPISETEDYGFGFYDGDVALIDEIAYNAPSYLMVKSAGNDRDDTGPAAGEYYWYWDPYLDAWDWINTPRDADGGATGYDTIGWKGNAKNILTVGAVFDIAGGWTAPGDVVMSPFSNWGPTDDGRIKPDLVANGIALYSTIDLGPTEYASYSGTSMAGPNASGALNLLYEQYEDAHAGVTPSSATIKGLALHTANEAGPTTGPDYSFGWGMLDIRKAAMLIAEDEVTGNNINQLSLDDHTERGFVFYSDGVEPIALTLCWTDPAGTPPPYVLDPTDQMLVNDLDMSLMQISDLTETMPWVLDPANPAAAATTGDNVRDNVERIDVASPAAGWYRVNISHKGTLQDGPQAFTFIQSGLRQMFHVSTGGSDSDIWAGFVPFATNQYAVDMFLGAGEVIIEPGTYAQAQVQVAKTVDIHGQTGNPSDVVIAGGGFEFIGVGGRLAHVTVTEATDAAVRCTAGAAPLLEGCVFAGNTDDFGSGVYVDASSPIIRSCTLVNNAGGLGCIYTTGGSDLLVERSIIAFNDGSAVMMSGASDDVTLVCCDLYDNIDGDWSGDIALQVDLDGNFSADPCFCDAAGGVYTLSADSWAAAGAHPWGCDDLVGALDVGCGSMGCAGAVANFLPELDLQLAGDTVRILWSANGEDDPEAFRVTRAADGVYEDIAVVGLGDYDFQAVDTDVVTKVAADVSYTLYYNEGNGWTQVAERSLDITLPELTTRLVGASPNPFNPETRVVFSLSRGQHVLLAVYDVTGRRIATIGDGLYTRGTHAVDWLGRDDGGRAVSSGTYFVRMTTESGVQSEKLSLIR